MRDLTLRYGAKLFKNDLIDIAMVVMADGVNLGERSVSVETITILLGEKMMIGITCHPLKGAVAACNAGVDFITFGPIN